MNNSPEIQAPSIEKDPRGGQFVKAIGTALDAMSGMRERLTSGAVAFYTLKLVGDLSGAPNHPDGEQEDDPITQVAQIDDLEEGEDEVGKGDVLATGELLAEELAQADFMAPAAEWENFNPLQAEFIAVEPEEQEVVLFQDSEADRADVGV